MLGYTNLVKNSRSILIDLLVKYQLQLTLGFEGNPWSIYMAGNKIDMQVGDAVLISRYGCRTLARKVY
jgi:hypothetical protein